MMIKATKIMVVVLAVFATSASAASQPPSTSPAGNPERGKTAFMNAGCYTCHGTVGQGGAGARLAPKPRAQAAFVAYVRSGRRGWSVAGGMPAYPPKFLSDADLADIYAYLSSIPAPREIPMLKE
jgi:ubiquinol-cytochrome c reductase cytochrome c subunit